MNLTLEMRDSLLQASTLETKEIVDVNCFSESLFETAVQQVQLLHEGCQLALYYFGKTFASTGRTSVEPDRGSSNNNDSMASMWLWIEGRLLRS